MLWVSDDTHVSTWQGFVCAAFVVGTFAHHIVGWKVSASPGTDFVLDALEQALYKRRPVRQDDVPACMVFPRQQRTKLHSTNPIERLPLVLRMKWLLREQKDEWQTSSRYEMVDAFAQIDKEEIDPIPSITTKAA